MVLNISMISPCSAFLFSYMIQSSPIDSLYKKNSTPKLNATSKFLINFQKNTQLRKKLNLNILTGK